MTKTYQVVACCTNCKYGLCQLVSIPKGKHFTEAENKQGSGYGSWHKTFWSREKFIECEKCNVAALELA